MAPYGRWDSDHDVIGGQRTTIRTSGGHLFGIDCNLRDGHTQRDPLPADCIRKPHGELLIPALASVDFGVLPVLFQPASLYDRKHAQIARPIARYPIVRGEVRSNGGLAEAGCVEVVDP